MGLLSRTLSLSQEKKVSEKTISFIQFTKKFNISLCALFSKIDNNYLITNSVGFDGISIISSISTNDFWDGTINNPNKWYSFTTNSEMVPFFQLFSFNQKDKIKGIYICRFEDKVFMVCSTESINFIPNDSIIKELFFINFDTKEDKKEISINLEKNENIYKFQIDVKNAIEFLVGKNLRKLEYKNIIQNSILNEIYLFLEKSFSYPNLISTNSFGIFNIAFVSESQLSEKLLQTHLIKELYSILDEESNLLILANLGKSNSYKDVMDFLQAK